MGETTETRSTSMHLTFGGHNSDWKQLPSAFFHGQLLLEYTCISGQACDCRNLNFIHKYWIKCISPYLIIEIAIVYKMTMQDIHSEHISKIRLEFHLVHKSIQTLLIFIGHMHMMHHQACWRCTYLGSWCTPSPHMTVSSLPYTYGKFNVEILHLCCAHTHYMAKPSSY